MSSCEGKFEQRSNGFQSAVLRARIPGGRRAAFTLVELLVVITILGVLAGLSVAGVSKAMDMAGSVKESAAAKTLVTAYLSAASDNNGFFMPGYDRAAPSIQLPDGSANLSGPAAQRYPYRLAPYFNYDIKGTLLTSDNATIDVSDHYRVSAFPSFGINYLFVGGDVSSSGDISNPRECLQVAGKEKSSILVFATAAGSGGGEGSSEETVQGFCKLEPPRYTSRIWAAAPWTRESDPSDYGQMDARHGGKAVCAFSDGSVRKLTVEELKDMRLWSYQAANADKPNYTVTSAGSGGGR